ncbi:hypothetical protein PSYMP_29626, partial [Pseudomonas amygdali pv. morsprunorum str. M302280]
RTGGTVQQTMLAIQALNPDALLEPKVEFNLSVPT